MINSPTDSKLRNNPLLDTPYFDDYSLPKNATPPDAGALLQENGYFILQENGFKILLG